MKRATSIISAFCLGLFISIGILACAVDDYATPNTNNAPSSDLQLCKMEINGDDEYLHTNISYGNDGRISTITFISDDGRYHAVNPYNIIYDTNKIILSCEGKADIDLIFNNELHSYSAETINNQIFHGLSIWGIW